MDELDIDRLDLTSLTPQDFARLVKQTPKQQLAGVLAGSRRRQILDEIFDRMRDQFLPDKAGSRRAAVHWRITGRSDGGYDEYELVIADGSCTVNSPPEQEPRVTITLDAVEFLALVSGNASATTMFLTRKLTLDGDLGLGAGLTDMFAIPQP